MSPFAAIISHPHLAVYVRNIGTWRARLFMRRPLGSTFLLPEIRAVPMLKSRLHPNFVRDCKEALKLCKNLNKFKCTVPGVLAIFLPALEDKRRLESVRIHANLTTDQAQMLRKFGTLQSLAIEFATWNVADMLPTWIPSISETLSSLTLYVRTFCFVGCCVY